MTMMQKIQAKKSKKGFTLVELVIVIAILAILAAIAIPVITTTINSSKLSTMKSDMATTDMLLKEAINTSRASIYTTTYGPDKKTFKATDTATQCDVTVALVLEENNISKPNGTDYTQYFQRKIGNKTYDMRFKTDGQNTSFAVTDAEGKTTENVAFGGTLLTGDKPISAFAPEGA